MDLKLVISLTLCHYVLARPPLAGDDHEVKNAISNLQLLIPLLIQDAQTKQESNSHESESENTNQHLPMPIQAFLQPNDESQHPQPNTPKQKPLPLDGPFSDIPFEAFQIDRSRSTKKDLSSTPEAVVPEDLVQQCTGYFGGSFRPSRGKEELILNVCTELLDAGVIKNYANVAEGQEHALRIDTRGSISQGMDDEEFLLKVREFVREYENLLKNREDSKSYESTNINEAEKPDDESKFTNLDRFKERDDDAFNEIKNLEDFYKHSDNTFHKFKSLDDQKNDDNIFHGIDNLKSVEKDDDNTFHANPDEVKGLDVEKPESKTERIKEFRIDVDNENDVKLVVNGETLAHCDCCPNGVHRVKAEATARGDGDDDADEGSVQAAFQKILGLLTQARSRK